MSDDTPPIDALLSHLRSLSADEHIGPLHGPWLDGRSLRSIEQLRAAGYTGPNLSNPKHAPEFAEFEEVFECEWIQVADLYQDQEPYEPDLISPGVLAAGDTMLLAGPPKSMKSLVALDMARAFVLGRTWLDLTPSEPLCVAYMQFELKRDGVRRRLQLAPLPADESERMRGRFVTTPRFAPILTDELYDDVARGLDRALERPPHILLIDPIANIFTGDNENDNTQFIRFLLQLIKLRDRIDPACCLALIHHASKKSKTERAEEPFNAIRGASSLRGFYDAGFYIERQSKDILRVWNELRNGSNMGPYTLKFDGGRFTDMTGDVRIKVIDEVICAAAECHAYTLNALANQFCEEWGIGQAELGVLLRQMLDDDEICLFQPRSEMGLTLPRNAKGLVGIDGLQIGAGRVRAMR